MLLLLLAVSKQPGRPYNLSSAPRQVKIIAGRWRGAKIPVLLKDHIRPTPARVRETLFNWLRAYLPGSHCLDLFAGSGALGFEAMSRGAQHVTLVDNDSAVIQLLGKQIARLNSKQIHLVNSDGLKFLADISRQFDIVFLDPPFTKFKIENILQVLAGHEVLKPGALIYAESAPENFPQNLPANWRWQRQSRAGHVEYGLIATS